MVQVILQKVIFIYIIFLSDLHLLVFKSKIIKKH